jgi:hypothetical protein
MTPTQKQIAAAREALAEGFAQIAEIPADIAAEALDKLAPIAAQAAIEKLAGNPNHQYTTNILRGVAMDYAMDGVIRANRETAQLLARIAEAAVVILKIGMAAAV